MTTSDGGKYDGGFHLVEMVQAQRGLSDLEIEIFLATGQKPDLSLPPLEEQEDLDDGDRPVIAADTARAWLGGEPLTADAFYDFDPHHEVSPHYDALVASGVAFKFNPNQPRDDDGRWTDGFPGVDTPDFKPPSGKSGKSTLGAGTKKSTPAIIYKKHDDGATIAQSKTGDKRMRWDGGRKKFVVEQNKNGDWVEEAAHTKGAAYNDMKEPDKWFEPVETGTEGEIPTSSQTPEPDLADTDTTAETPELPAETVESGDVEVDTSPTVETPDVGDDVKTAGPDILLHDGESVFTGTKAAGTMYMYPGTKPYTPEWSARNDYVDEEVSVPLNRKLRQGKPLGPSQQKIADVMDATIAKYETEYEADVFRAVRISDDLFDSWTTPGSTITDPAFMSTATSRAMAERSLQTNSGNAAMMKIRLPKGTNAAPGLVDTHNNDDGAGELVLGRNTTFQITDAKKNDNGIWEISANVVPKTSDDAPDTQQSIDDDWTPPLAKIEPGLQSRAVDSYKIGGYAATNRQLRTGVKQKLISMDTDELIKGLDEAMNNNVLEKPTSVWRGLNVSPGDLTPGTVLEDKAFLSTTFDRAQAEDFAFSPPDINANGPASPTLMNISVPAGTKALHLGTGEEELLLNRGTKLKITGSRKENGLTIVDAELVHDEPADAELPDVVDEPQHDVTPEIPQQTDAPAIETDTPGVYTGPAIDYAGAPKDITDKVRAAYVADYLHTQKVEDRAEELRKDKEKYSGYDAYSKSIEDARAELGGGPPVSDQDNALKELEKALPEYTVRDNVRRRLALEAAVEAKFTKFADKNGLGALTPEVKADLTQRMKQAFANKKVAVRVSPKTVAHILTSGRIKSQFETNKSSGKKDVDMRASVERLLFGIDDKPWQNAEKRPIYGYVAMDGVRPVGIGSGQLGDPSTDALTQYGNVQVVLKDSVRDRTTAMFGDSLNNMQEAIPTPINNPDWRSFQASRGGITGKGLTGLDRSGENQEFRAGAYAEAQIHGGIGVEDIEEIVFASTPPAETKKLLEDSGIPWRVLNFTTAIHASPDERRTALRIAQEDKPFIEGEIKKIHEKMAKYGDSDGYYKKDLAKYEKQLKAIDSALPKLKAGVGQLDSNDDTQTPTPTPIPTPIPTPTSVPEQPNAPEVESTPGTKLSAAEEKELIALQNQISELYGQSGYWRMLGAEITHKSGTGKILTKQDIADSTQADNELKKLRDNATPLVERELELRMKRDGDLFGEVDDPNAERWATKNAPASVMLPGNDPAKIDKIADSYRINDKQTTEHNMSLRSGEPSQAAVSWRSRMKRMINSQQLDKDSVVYRGAALTPERIMQLRPGAVMIDPGSMSTDESRGSAEFYMKTRLGDLPGTLPTLFEIRAPKGMPVADVDYGEFVFDFDTPMRIISTKRDDNGVVNVVAELVPPDEAKALYGAPPVPKASKASSVNLNEGKRGSINAKEAKRIQELSFAKNGIQPWSPPQEIFDQAKKTAHYNNWSVMQVLEAIDAIKPGYKKPVLDWVKTPEGNEYVSKTPTS